MERLTNLLASATLGLHDDATRAMEGASGLSESAVAGLLALEEFLDGTSIGPLADVLGLTHSGAVRLVALLEREGLADRSPGAEDRRVVEVRLTEVGRRRAAVTREARDEVLEEALAGLGADRRDDLEALLAGLVAGRVRARMARRSAGQETGAWWCRTCDFGACGRDEGRCPAQQAAAPAGS